MIPFNKPFLTGHETRYIEEAVASGKISGDGLFTKKCHRFFEEKYGFAKCLLTTSCTDALEMAAILIDIQPGDEVIMPAYTFVSTANAFVLRGAKVVFCDSRSDHPCMDEDLIEGLITPKTKAIVPVHYAGMACNMEKILALAGKYKLWVIEDAAQAIDSYYTFSDGRQQPLGSLGHLAAFSFHETKNIISGEGGMLVINNEELVERAEIIREKGTNRSKFFRGEVDKYGWVDIGSSFLPSDIIAAFLYAQLENLEAIQQQRKALWELYNEELAPLQPACLQLPKVPGYATNNGHMFYVLTSSLKVRNELIEHCKREGILTVFHYLSLNQSPHYTSQYGGQPLLPNSDRYTDTLLRLPLYCGLSFDEVKFISATIRNFFRD